MAGAVVVLGAWPAVRADDAGPPSYRAVIDRVDLEPASIGGLELRVALSALALQGQLLDLSDPRTIKVTVGGSKLDAPYALGTYAPTNPDTAIAIVVQANQPYAETIGSITAALDDAVLSQLGDHTQIAVLAYGEATGTGKLVGVKAGRAKLLEVSADATAAEPALIDTVERALLVLRKAKTSPEGRPLRKLIVVIGDGHDRAGDRDRVTGVGKRAEREGVRIHTFGYAPSKVLRPLLTLGELSKRSLGTFRWVRSGGAESWGPAFQQLREEINRQYVLTFFVPADADLAGKKLKIATVGRTEATSNEVKIPAALCGHDPCAGYCVDSVCSVPRGGADRGVVGWVVLVIGIAVGAIAVLGLIGYVLQRRQQVVAAMPGQPGAPGPFQPAGFPPGAPPKPAKRPRRGAAPAPPPSVAPPPSGPSLLVISGPRTGERIALSNGFTIGKAPESNLVLDDGYTSGHHAQVGVDPSGSCRLYDRNSTNGTYVNGVRVTEVVLDHGMSVRIGSTELRFLAQ
jgi:hypothetical protein